MQQQPVGEIVLQSIESGSSTAALATFSGASSNTLGGMELQQQPVDGVVLQNIESSSSTAARVTLSGASSTTSSNASAKEKFFLCYGEIWRVTTDHLGKESIAAYKDGRPLPTKKIAPRNIPAVDLFPFMKKKVPATSAASGVASSTAPATAIAPTVRSPQPPSAAAAPATAIAPTGPQPQPPSAASGVASSTAPATASAPSVASGVPKSVAKSRNRRSGHLCKFYMQKGVVCTWGAKCKYAHGPVEA